MKKKGEKEMKKIPKILHLYWDKSPMSWLQTLTVESFHRYNPEWKIIVYVPDIPYRGEVKYVPDYIGKDYFDRIEKMEYVKIETFHISENPYFENLHDILRSDILRYRMLYLHGGVWSDFDVLYLKPMSHILNINTHAGGNIEEMQGSVCFYKTTYGFHSIGVMLFTKQHKLLKAIIDKTKELQNANVKKYQSFGTTMLNAMIPNFWEIQKKYSNIIALPYATFYPYDTYNLNPLYNSNDLRYLKASTVALHWFNGKPLSKEYVNKEIYHKPCSMTTILKKEGWL